MERTWPRLLDRSLPKSSTPSPPPPLPFPRPRTFHRLRGATPLPDDREDLPGRDPAHALQGLLLPPESPEDIVARFTRDGLPQAGVAVQRGEAPGIRGPEEADDPGPHRRGQVHRPAVAADGRVGPPEQLR